MQYGYYFDSTRCTGCKACEMACKDYWDLGPEFTFRRVINFDGGEWTQEENGAWTTTAFTYHVSYGCNHCDKPACVEKCPTGAMVKDAETGLVNTDKDVCIGCGTCVQACPYGAPALDEAQNIARKCDGCLARVRDGLNPMCMDACPMRALYFGDIEELRAQYGANADIVPLPDSSETLPNYIVKLNSAAESDVVSTGFIANPLEIE